MVPMKPALVALALLLAAVIAAAQDSASQLEKLIEHYRQAEARHAKLIKALEDASVVMAIPHTGSQRIPIRKSEILDYLVSVAVAAELGKPKPDAAAAERRARDTAEQWFKTLDPYNRQELTRLKALNDQLRKSRERAEARLRGLRTNDATIGRGNLSLEGRWRRDTDGWEVSVVGDVLDEKLLLGMNRFVPEFARFAFNAGERIWEFRRDPDKAGVYSGRWMFRSWSNGDRSSIRTEWRNVSIRMPDNDHVIAGDGTGNWTRIGADNLVGTWRVRVSTPFSWYDYRWDIRANGDGIYTAEQTLLDTNHGFHKASIGKKFHNYTLTKKGDRFELYGSETDANPGNPGSFTQMGTITLTKDGLSGEGEHKGTKLTHWIKFVGTKDKP